MTHPKDEAKATRPHHDLIAELLNPNIPKTEREHAASREIERLQALAAPTVQEPVACFIGAKGSAFDLPETKRAYTYKEQPGNAVASKLGRACEAASKQRAGDNIDRGLGLLQELQKEGFGVFALGAEYTTPPAAQPAAQEIVCSTGLCHYKAVPDAIHHTDLSEHPEYISGWNDYRQAMMEMMK